MAPEIPARSSSRPPSVAIKSFVFLRFQPLARRLNRAGSSAVATVVSPAPPLSSRPLSSHADRRDLPAASAACRSTEPLALSFSRSAPLIFPPLPPPLRVVAPGERKTAVVFPFFSRLLLAGRRGEYRALWPRLPLLRAKAAGVPRSGLPSAATQRAAGPPWRPTAHRKRALGPLGIEGLTQAPTPVDSRRAHPR